MVPVVPIGAPRALPLSARKPLTLVNQNIRSNKSDQDLERAKGIILSVSETIPSKSKENPVNRKDSLSVPPVIDVDLSEDEFQKPSSKSIQVRSSGSKVLPSTLCRNKQGVSIKASEVALSVPPVIDADLSEDEFQKPSSKSIQVRSSESNKVLPSTCRKKPGVGIKASEVDTFIAEIEEKNLNTESFVKVHDMMPGCATYVVESCESINNEGTQWNACVRANMSTKEQAREWLSKFEGLNSVDFRVRDAKSENSDRLVFKRVYRCHHNTMPKSKASTSKQTDKTKKKTRIINSKNTDCPASLSITIKQTTMKWSSDMLLNKYPCVIKIKHCHNHPVYAAEALRRRRPSKDTEQKFIDLLVKGHSALSAIECHKLDLRMEHGDNYFKVAADASICPSNFWVYKLFTKLCITKYGPQCGDEMLDALKKMCNDYNAESNSICAKVELFENDHLAVAICTPLMKRVHTLIKASAEMMFVDSSGSMDSLNCRVFPILTSSVAGGLPLGILITTSEKETVVHFALELWKTLLPEKAFFGRGASVGPKLIMTDDATAERNALHMSFMTAILLLCLFHVLQAYWRFVWAREQNVPKNKRSELFYIFKDLVYAEDEEIFKSRLDDAMNNEELNKYPKVKEHLKSYIPRSAEWALCMRSNLMTRGHITDNIGEAGIKVFKDKIFNRLKAFNPVQLCDFILTRYDSYIQNRLIEIYNNRAINQVKSRFYIRPEKLVDLECEELERPNTYCVKNLAKNTTNYVVMDYEICSCEAGKSGKPCKHLCAVVQKYKLSSSVIHPLLQCDNPAMKKVLFEVAHGHVNFPADWFSSLFNQNHNAEPQQQPQSNLETVDPLDSLGEELAPANEIPLEAIQKAESALSEIFSSWSSQLKTDPATFLGPIESFIKNSAAVSKSQSSLVSAMHCFGKSGGVSAIGSRKKNLSTIPVQTTAPGRRTAYFGGRTAQFCGRPSKAMTSTASSDQEHCYGSTQKRKTHEPSYAHLPKRPRIAAPHNLQLCVQTSRMIGK